MNRIILASSLALSLLTARAAFGADKAPVPAKVPTATDGMIEVAKCNSGKTMYAKTNEHRGACSGEGGVLSWSDGTPVKSHARKTQYR